MDPLASVEALDAANTSSLIGQILILVALPPTRASVVFRRRSGEWRGWSVKNDRLL
jgi:hypothetical protein